LAGRQFKLSPKGRTSDEDRGPSRFRSMTDKTRQRIEVAALAVAFGAGSGWGAFQVKFASFDARLAVFETQLTRIDVRVADIYCAQVPVEKRAGCR